LPAVAATIATVVMSVRRLRGRLSRRTCRARRTAVAIIAVLGATIVVTEVDGRLGL
jgi:hypothetical protein